MPPKKHIIIIGVLCVIALGLGYWVGLPKGGSVNAEELSKEDVAGEYEHQNGGNTKRLVLPVNDLVEVYVNNEKVEEHKWEIVDDEIQIEHSVLSSLGNGTVVHIHRINHDDSLTWVATTTNGARRDVPEEHQPTYKKNK